MGAADKTISLARVLPAKKPAALWRGICWLLDRCLGLARLEALYRAHRLAGLPPGEFAWRTLEVLGVELREGRPLLAQIPESGPVLVVANHPLGGVEGVALAALLSRRRADVRILANRALAIFPELRPLFIFTDPFRANGAGNSGSLRQCHRHLAQGGVLVVFPAGRVSFHDKRRGLLVDYPWHRMLGQLLQRHPAAVLPLHIGGRNSPGFYRLGKVHPRLRLLLLVREMLGYRGKALLLNPGRLVQRRLPTRDTRQTTELLRLLCYLQKPEYQRAWPPLGPARLQPLAPPVARDRLVADIDGLPGEQLLLRQGDFLVYYGSAAQMPSVLAEIRRLREYTFRFLDEGSGQPADGDDYDSCYTHLFIYHRGEEEIVGAYRMGQTDRLLSRGGLEQLYLSRVFDFGDEFANRYSACLEMGRSFIVPQWQRSYQSLLLLFKGIGAFVKQHRRYRTLYGTVSLSRQYDPLSVLLIEQFLVDAGESVTAKTPFVQPLPPELEDYLGACDNLTREQRLAVLEWLVRQIEEDGKGLPVLLKQYHHMGARFHGLALDSGFAHTPGLLLSAHIPSVPPKLLKRYLGDNALDYVNSTMSDLELLQGEPS